jgi:hypothetical protein
MATACSKCKFLAHWYPYFADALPAGIVLAQMALLRLAPDRRTPFTSEDSHSVSVTRADGSRAVASTSGPNSMVFPYAERMLSPLSRWMAHGRRSTQFKSDWGQSPFVRSFCWQLLNTMVHGSEASP